MEDRALKQSFFKKSRRGQVLRIVHEHYLREDLQCGYLHQQPLSADKLAEFCVASPYRQLLVLDTNICLHCIDALEYSCALLSLIVVPQTTLQEVKHRNLSAFRRLVSLLKDQKRSFIFYPNEASIFTSVQRCIDESVNDANDRSVATTAAFFERTLREGRGSEGEQGSVVLLTNDKGCQERCASMGVTALGMREYVLRYALEYPELADLVAADEQRNAASVGAETLFPAHISANDIAAGLKAKIFLKGTLRISRRDASSEGYVVVHSAGDGDRRSVLIRGSYRMNRAIEGDIVAVQLVENATDESKELLIAKVSSSGASGLTSGRAEISQFTAEATVEGLEGLPDTANIIGKKYQEANGTYGQIVGVIRRDARQFAGSLDSATVANVSTTISAGSSGSLTTRAVDEVGQGTSAAAYCALFVPVDKRIPRIWITTRRLEELEGFRLLVAIDSWPANSPYPLGHYVQLLGKDGDKQVETQVLLHEFQVPHQPFSAEVMACLPPPDWKITEELVAQRSDLRAIPVVSIDPPGCKDIDDALHCVRLPDGRLEAGVHIADVTHFVQPDSPLDIEAAHRSTSTYLVERRLDMLPSLLTTELCSLRSGEDHLAFSVIWTMDDDANIYDVRFCKSVIHSVASLTYDQAQEMLDRPGEGEDEVQRSVKLLNKLAHILRTRRIEMGALTLASPEVRFKLDEETESPTDVSTYALKEANALVEEWMLLANITVSKQTLRFYPTLSILRRHQPPTRDQFAPLLAAAAAVGISLDISSSKTLADSLDRAERSDDPYFNKLLRILSTRCMMPAQYLCSGEIPKDQWHHYGLAAAVYTHFTSPIRRYADVLVHRLLASSIGVIPLPASNSDRSKQRDLCSHMNRRHKAAQQAQRASVGLHTLLYFRGRPTVETAYILSIGLAQFSVLVPKFGIEGSIAWLSVQRGLGIKAVVDGESDASFDQLQHRYTLMTNGGLQSWRVFDQVQVSLRVNDSSSGADRTLVIGLVHNGIDLAASEPSRDN